jgi:hypothetical protein
LCDFAEVAELPEPEVATEQPKKPVDEMTDAEADGLFLRNLGIRPPAGATLNPEEVQPPFVSDP